MNWAQARQILRFKRIDPVPSTSTDAGDLGTDPLASVRATSICIVSGKGGTGKSTVCASLSSMLARTGRTLVFDGDLGVANAHILHDVHPERTAVDALEGRCQLRDVVHPCGEQLDLIAGGSGYAQVAGLKMCELELLAAGLERLERQYRFLVVDAAAGLSHQTVEMAAASDRVIVVTTPDVTAMTDAYAFLKVLVPRKPLSVPQLVINRVTCPEEADHAARRIQRVSKKFLGFEPEWIASLPEDRAAFRCTQRRMPVVRGEEDSELAVALRDLTHGLLEDIGRHHPRGLGRALLHRLREQTRTA
tara:strand:- start:5836 stop:6750 length:915 start_codon:yes stop_codon:yes gene_type:complete